MVTAPGSLELVFIQVLKTLVRSGLPLSQGLRQWGVHLAGKDGQGYFLGVGDALENGRTMASALEESRFPMAPSTRHILSHLETSPDPGRLLESLEASHMENTRSSEQIRESLIYPAAILMAFIGALIILTYTFYEAVYLYQSAAPKPALFALLSFFRPVRYLLWALFPLGALLVFRLWAHPRSLPLPIVRGMFLASQRAQFCQFLQLEMAAGRTLPLILEAAHGIFDPAWAPDLAAASAQARAGEPVAVPVRGILSGPIQYVLNRSGSAAAAVDILEKLRAYYTRDFQMQSLRVRWVVETWAVALLGLLVGFLVAQTFLTLYGYFYGTAIY